MYWICWGWQCLATLVHLSHAGPGKILLTLSKVSLLSSREPCELGPRPSSQSSAQALGFAKRELFREKTANWKNRQRMEKPSNSARMVVLFLACKLDEFANCWLKLPGLFCVRDFVVSRFRRVHAVGWMVVNLTGILQGPRGCKVKCRRCLRGRWQFAIESISLTSWVVMHTVPSLGHWFLGTLVVASFSISRGSSPKFSEFPERGRILVNEPLLFVCPYFACMLFVYVPKVFKKTHNLWFQWRLLDTSNCRASRGAKK